MPDQQKSCDDAVEQRRDAALRRALNTSPEPKTKKIKGDGKEASVKPRRKVAREV